MTIVIPEDDNINEIVIDVRDILRGAEIEFNADKEFQMAYKSLTGSYDNAFVSEFVFTLQKTDFKFYTQEPSFLQNFKKILKSVQPKILSAIENKYKKMNLALRNHNRSYRSGNDSKSVDFNKRFMKYIKKQYFNISDSRKGQIMLLKKGEKIILGEPVFDSSVQLISVSIVNSSKKLGLDTPNLKNVKIRELGLCPENTLVLTLDNLTSNSKGVFKYNRYITDKISTKENEHELGV